MHKSGIDVVNETQIVSLVNLTSFFNSRAGADSTIDDANARCFDSLTIVDGKMRTKYWARSYVEDSSSRPTVVTRSDGCNDG